MDPTLPSLTEEETKLACEDKIKYYPEVMRSACDPQVLGQTVGNIAFNLFKEPRHLKNGKPIYGFFKLRGNFPDKDVAIKHAIGLIKEVDSKNVNRIALVGAWHPIVDDNTFSEKVIDVKLDEKEAANKEAIKEREETEARIQRELRENADKLKNEPDIYDDPQSLRFYSMKRVTEMKLTETIDTLTKKLEEIQDKRKETWGILAGVETNHPEYQNQWLECYNEERKKPGLPAFVPSERQFDDYNKYRSLS